MAASQAPVQPLPPWMQTTWLSVDPSRSTFVTIQFPQTYSGPTLPGLTWPWAYASPNPSGGTVVSIVGGSEGLLTVDGSDSGESIQQPTRAPSDTASVPTGPLSTASSSAVASASFASSSSFPSSNSSSSSGVSQNSSFPTPSAVAPSSSASSSFTTSSLRGDPSDAFRSTGLSGGAIAGIVLGALVGMLVLLLLLVLCLKRRRRQTSLNSFTFLDPELQPEDSSASAPNMRSISARMHRERQAPTAITGSSGEYAQRPGPFHEPETEGLMAHHDGVLDPNENAQEYIIAPPIVLQSSSSGASVRHCPSNNSISTMSVPSANNTDSTRTRASLISQFPTAHDRRPSDHSSRGGHGPSNSTGKPPNSTSGNQGDTRETGGKHSSGGSNIGGDPFTSPPPRPPSRTRSVANSYNGQTVGIGRPLTSLHGRSLSRLDSLSQRTGENGNEAPHAGSSAFLRNTGSALERSMSNRSSISMHGAPFWMKDFNWLKPFFDAGSHPAIMEGCASEANEDTPQALHNEDTSTQDTAGKKLLPTEVPVMRATPGYRRVTTTAAAYDIQDLRDLSQRPTGQPGDEDDAEGLDSGSDGEQDSLLHSPQAPSPPESVRAASQGQSRWSRATLGQPLQRVSELSSLSLSDIRSISESMTSSARARAKSRSRSGSHSDASQLLHVDTRSNISPVSALSRASSRGTISSRGHSNSSRSRSGSGIEASRPSQQRSKRRNNNSSNVSNGSSTSGSHRSLKSGRSGLNRVIENPEAVPALPAKPHMVV